MSSSVANELFLTVVPALKLLVTAIQAIQDRMFTDTCSHLGPVMTLVIQNVSRT